MNENMGQIIKHLRKERNLTQEELAEQLNVSAQAISKWENGTSMPDISQVVPIANFFEISTDILFSRNVHKNNQNVKLLIQNIENSSDGNDYTRFEKLKSLLDEYPANTDVLEAIVRRTKLILASENCNESIFLYAIRSADLYIDNTKKLGDVVRMYANKIDLYASAGRYAEAEELARELKMPIISSEMYLAHISEKSGNYCAEIQHEQESITLLLGYLASELEKLAVAYRKNNEIEKALEVNITNIKLIHTIHQENAFHAPLFNFYSICGFEIAYELVLLKKYNEALEMLEKIFDYGETQCRHCANHSPVVSPILDKIDLTLFHGELKLSDYLWKINRAEFKPLHKYKRFQILLERYKNF